LALRLTYEVSFSDFSARTRGGLRPGVYAILRVINSNPGLNLTVLGEAVGRDKSTLSVALKTLERDGFIQRCQSQVDRRNRQMSLTRKGKRYLAYLAEHAAAHDAELDQIIGDNKELLLDLLARIRRQLER
jgi:DNA-binding MarR family transcriptional regulator